MTSVPGLHLDTSLRTGGICFFCDLEFCPDHIEVRKAFTSIPEAKDALRAHVLKGGQDDEKARKFIADQEWQDWLDNSMRRACPRCGITEGSRQDAYRKIISPLVSYWQASTTLQWNETAGEGVFEQLGRFLARMRTLGVPLEEIDQWNLQMERLQRNWKQFGCMKRSEKALQAGSRGEAIAQLESGLSLGTESDFAATILLMLDTVRAQFATELDQTATGCFTSGDLAGALGHLEKALAQVVALDQKKPTLEATIRRRIRLAQNGLELEEASKARDYGRIMVLIDLSENLAHEMIDAKSPDGASALAQVLASWNQSRVNALNQCLAQASEALSEKNYDQSSHLYDAALQMMTHLREKLWTTPESYNENRVKVVSARDNVYKAKSDELRRQGRTAWAAQDYEKAVPLLEESNELLLPFSGEPAVAKTLKNVRLQLLQHYVQAAGQAEQERNSARTEEYYSKILAVAEPYVDVSDIALIVRQVLHMRGSMRFRQSNYREALADSLKLAGLDPTNEIAHYNVACAYARLGQREQALLSLRRSLELEAAKGQKSQLTSAKADPDFDSLRTSPQFRSLLTQFEA